MAKRKLTEKQKRFCQEYVVDFNATKASERAGYSTKTAFAIGHENLKKPNIQEEIQEQTKKIAKSTQITAERVLKELGRLAFYNPQKFFKEDGSLVPITELSEDDAACIAGMDLVLESRGEGQEPAAIRKIKLSSKDSALDKLMRHLGLYKDRLEIDAGDDLVTILTKAEERVRGGTE